MIDWLSDQALVKMAARIGAKFAIDPIDVLRDGGDSFINQVRVAALNVVVSDEKAAEEAARKK